MRIDGDAVVDHKTSVAGKFDIRDGADTNDDQISGNPAAILSQDPRVVRTFRQFLDRHAAKNFHALRLVPRGDHRRQFRGHTATEDAWQALNQRYLGAELAGGCGKLQADEAAADDGQMRPRRQARADRNGVAVGAQCPDTMIGARKPRKGPGPGAGRQQQAVIGKDLTIGKPCGLAGGVDALDAVAGQNLDPGIGIAGCVRNQFRFKAIEQRLLRTEMKTLPPSILTG
jgi:hypothetical protein